MLTRIHKIRTFLLIGGTLLFLSACGLGENSLNTPVVETNIATEQKGDKEVDTNYMVIGSEDYKLLKPNFYYSTDNWSFWSIQANIAEDVSDIKTLNVIRIDVTKENGRMPTSLNKIFSIEGSSDYEKFSGNMFVFTGKNQLTIKLKRVLSLFNLNRQIQAL